MNKLGKHEIKKYFTTGIGKMPICTHLVTGDLLILSGSSVTLKKKTNVYVRNQSVNHDPQAHPSPTSYFNAHQPITTQGTTSCLQITDIHSLHWMDVQRQNVRVPNKTNEKDKQM